MKKLLYILLFVCPFTFGQSWNASSGGLAVDYNGSAINITADNFPPTSPPYVPPLSTFIGTKYKQVTFAELSPDQNSDARAQVFFNSSFVRGGTATDSLYADSTAIIVNDQAVSDTVWKVKFTDRGGGASAYGVDWYGNLYANGINTNGDTLSWMNLSYYFMFDEDLDFDIEGGWGGKTPGFGGVSTTGQPSPTGGIYDCGCPGSPNMCDTDGFRISGMYHWDGDDFGTYSYYPGMSFSGCTVRSGIPATKNLIHGTGSLSWERNKWYKFTISVKLNSDASLSDGWIKWARNDTVYMHTGGLKIIENNAVKISDLWMNAFAGGSPTAAFDGCFVWIDDVTVWRENAPTTTGYGEVMTNVPDMPTPNTSE